MQFWDQPESIARWRSLLNSPDKANRKVAMMLAKAHAIPESLRDDVIIAKLSHTERNEVQIGMELVSTLGGELAMEALYFRYLVIGTVGTSYGWIKPFLNEAQKMQAGQVFKTLGYGHESETSVMLTKLKALAPEVLPSRIAYWLCAAPNIRQAIRHFAFQYLIEKDESVWIEKGLQHFLHENQLKLALLNTLPDAVFELKNIRSFSCWGGSGQLNIFPEKLSQMTDLEEIILPVNNLSYIPESLGQLKKLKVLNVSYNPIEVFPQCLQRMDALEKLIITRPMLIGEARNSITELQALHPALIIENRAA